MSRQAPPGVDSPIPGFRSYPSTLSRGKDWGPGWHYRGPREWFPAVRFLLRSTGARIRPGLVALQAVSLDISLDTSLGESTPMQSPGQLATDRGCLGGCAPWTLHLEGGLLAAPCQGFLSAVRRGFGGVDHVAVTALDP